MRAVLTIAGSDSSAGAGIQADLKTFAALGVYGASAVTAVTAQNTLGVGEIFTLPVDIVRSQIECIVQDVSLSAVKTGMLSTAEIVIATGDDERQIGIAHQFSGHRWQAPNKGPSASRWRSSTNAGAFHASSRPMSFSRTSSWPGVLTR